MKKLRQATVEPVLGTPINFMGIRRIWTRGLKNANKFMIGAAIAYNIKKWLTYTEQKGKTLIISLKRSCAFHPNVSVMPFVLMHFPLCLTFSFSIILPSTK
jgi:hypothetical protein